MVSKPESAVLPTFSRIAAARKANRFVTTLRAQASFSASTARARPCGLTLHIMPGQIGTLIRANTRKRRLRSGRHRAARWRRLARRGAGRAIMAEV